MGQTTNNYHERRFILQQENSHDKISETTLLVIVCELFDIIATMDLATIQENDAPYPLHQERSKISLSKLYFTMFLKLTGTALLGIADTKIWK